MFTFCCSQLLSVVVNYSLFSLPFPLIYNNSHFLFQPKAFKEFWFVFRSLNGGEKVLEYHQSERKFQECAAYPKGVVHLGNAQTVSYHNPEKKQQFSLELHDGTLIFLEASSESLAREWMNCLNAVLFGKGTGRESIASHCAFIILDINHM